MSQHSLETLVGKALRRARNAAGLTLADLAETSSVSVPMISKIERGQVSASLNSLEALARAIGIPLINFFAETVEVSEVALVRAGGGITVNRAGTTYGHEYRQIGRIEAAGHELETYVITLEAPVEGTPVFLHEGIEMMQLIEGALTYRVGDQTFDLGPGDTLSFKADVPHGPVRIDTAFCRFLTVISRPAEIIS